MWLLANVDPHLSSIIENKLSPFCGVPSTSVRVCAKERRQREEGVLQIKVCN